MIAGKFRLKRRKTVSSRWRRKVGQKTPFEKFQKHVTSDIIKALKAQSEKPDRDVDHDVNDEEVAFADAHLSNFASKKIEKSKNPGTADNSADLKFDNSDFNIFYSIDSSDYLPSPNMFTFCKMDTEEPKSNNQQRVSHCAEIVLQMRDKHRKLVPAKGLLDTGTTATMTLAKFARKGSSKSVKGDPAQWKTMGGMFTTHQRRLSDVTFLELHDPHKAVTWICHLDSVTNLETALHDIVTEMDMMTVTGICVNTAEKVIQWEGNTAPLCPTGAPGSKSVVNTLHSMSMEADILKQAESRQSRTMEANCDHMDITDHIQQTVTLSNEQRKLLVSKLKNFRAIFRGGSGELNMPPVHVELKEGAKPKKRRPFPLPQSQCHLMKDETNRLKNIGALAWVDAKQPGTGDPDFHHHHFLNLRRTLVKSDSSQGLKN